MAATRIVKRVGAIPGCNGDFKICSLVTKKGEITYINSAQALHSLCIIVELIGKENLSFSPEDIGLNSICSGVAMSMVFSCIPTIIIQRVGLWSSKEFLEYIREQIESSTFGVSEKMLQFGVSEKNVII